MVLTSVLTRQRIRLLWTLLGGLSLIIIVGGCAYDPPTGRLSPVPGQPPLFTPHSFQESDLLGQWETTFAPDSIETLVFTPDHRFEQTFDTNPPHAPERRYGTWTLEHRASGCLYVHMQGMHYLHGGDGTVPLWERCEQRFISMHTTVILIVTSEPNLPRGIGLLWPANGSDGMTGISMFLVADINGQPIPTPTKP